MQSSTYSPSSRYSPLSATSRQPMMFISVDFPLPEGPKMDTNSWGRTWRFTSFSTSTVVSPKG